MDGVGISIIERPRPLPGHDTPNAAHNTYTLKCEEPSRSLMMNGLLLPIVKDLYNASPTCCCSL